MRSVSVLLLAALAALTAAPAVVAVAAPSDACMAAAVSVLQCHFAGPGDTDGGWTPPPLAPVDFAAGAGSNPCCSTDLAAACGNASQFFALWNNPMYFEPVRANVLQTYLKMCRGGERVAPPFE